MLVKTLTAATLAAFLPLSALAMDMEAPVSATLGDLTIRDAYARVSSPVAKSGAAFFLIENTGSADDQLIAASSEASARVELHTHIDDGNGVMKMTEVEGGFPVPAGQTHALKRGGDHVMFMGLPSAWKDGDMVEVTLTFREAGDVTFMIPVDLERQDMHGGHGHMNHGGDS